MDKKYDLAEDMADYAKWVAAADGAMFEFADYVHIQILRGEITADSLGAIAGWFWPDFVETGGSVILSSKAHKFLELNLHGSPRSEVEYWCNFTNIDGTLPGLPIAFVSHLSVVIRDMWCAKLQMCFPSRKFTVEIVELMQDEVNVTFWERNELTGI